MLSDAQSPFPLFLTTQLHLDINSHHLDINKVIAWISTDIA